MDQVIIRKLTEIIHANLDDENFGVRELALASGMSRSKIHRKLKSTLKKSVSQFIREVRLQKAMEMLLQNVATVSEISYKVGFNSPAYFNSCFHHYFGYPPGEVKKRSLLDNEESNNKNPSENQPKSPGINLTRRGNYSRRPILFVSLIFLVLFALTYFMYSLSVGEPNPVNTFRLNKHEKSIAVLPFKNLSGNPENQYFADGIMEDILNNLCHIKELRVISRASVEEFRDSTINAQEIAKKLHVRYILEGSIQRQGDKAKVVIQLIDAKHDQHIWAEKFEKEMVDNFVIQSSIAKKVASELQAVISPKETERIEKISTDNPEAYDRYLMGRFFWSKRTKEGLKKSIAYFEEAIALDPDYAIAYAGLADAYFIQTWWRWMDRDEGFALAKKFVLQALEIDQNLCEAHATLGGLLCYDEWEWEKARKELLIAIELNPNYATAHQYYSELLDILGQTEEALEEINTALALEPYSKLMFGLESLYLYNQGKLKESLSACKSVEEIDSTYTSNYWRRFYIYINLGEDLKAVETFRKILTMNPTTVSLAGSVNEIYNKSKINGILKWGIDLELKKKIPSSARLAKWNILLGKKEESLKWLEKAMEMRLPDIPRIYTDPDYKILHNEPRFKKMIKQMGLSGYPLKSPAKNN